MDEKPSSKSTEYVENDFSTLNAHVDGILYNEKQISRLKKYRVDRVRIKQFGLIALILGILAILLAVAYHWFKAPVIRTIEVEVPKIVEVPVKEIIEVEIPKIVEVPVIEYITKIEYIPDPTLSIREEVPVYIEKIIRGPMQIVGPNDNFSFFHTATIDDIEGVLTVKVGASYESIDSPYPEQQWCYAIGKPKTSNTSNHIDLARKNGKNKPIFRSFSQSDANEFGASVDGLNKATKRCKWFPDRPAINEIRETSPPSTNEPENPEVTLPSGSSAYGTGFFINNNGYIVTNQHVIDIKDNNSIDNCSSVWVDDGSEKNIKATIVKQSLNLDLAVLRISKKTKNYAKFGSVRTGENVMVLGFPLIDLLGEELKVTSGNISALSGIKGDKNYLQYTAPSHFGNSGGPILNDYGFVVGIVKSGMIGEEYQNINFAIKGTSAQIFFGKNGIDFEAGKSIDELKGEDIADIGKQFTVKVICYN